MMPSIDDFPLVERLRVALISPPKVGKTRLAGTFPNPAFLDFDNGVATLADYEFREKYPHPIQYETFDEEYDDDGLLQSALAYRQAKKKIIEWKKDPTVHTIVLDSLTALGQFAQNAAVKANAVMNRSKTQARVEAGSMDFIISTEADYGSEMEAVNQIMNMLQSCGKSIVVCCHEREETNEAGVVVRRDPLVTGKRTRALFGRWFDEVWYLTAITNDEGGTDRILVTQPTAQLKVVGSRLKVPDRMVNPDYAKIRAAIDERQAKRVVSRRS